MCQILIVFKLLYTDCYFLIYFLYTNNVSQKFAAVCLASDINNSIVARRRLGNNLFSSTSYILTINVSVVYMGRYKVVLRGDYP